MILVLRLKGVVFVVVSAASSTSPFQSSRCCYGGRAVSVVTPPDVVRAFDHCCQAHELGQVRSFSFDDEQMLSLSVRRDHGGAPWTHFLAPFILCRVLIVMVVVKT